MRNFSSIPGAGGIAFIAIGSIVVSCIFTLVARTFIHWFALVAALIVGYWAIRVISGD